MNNDFLNKNEHISRYILNDLVIRHICTYIGVNSYEKKSQS